MSDARVRRIMGLVLLALASGLSAAAAVNSTCSPAAACPLMAGMPSTHCGSTTSLTANCCTSMQQAEGRELTRLAPAQLASLDRGPAGTDAAHPACPNEVAAPCPPRARAPALYTLLLTFLL